MSISAHTAPTNLHAGAADDDEQGKSLSEYLAGLKRRRLEIICIAVSLFGISALIAMAWPASYRSTATILIQEQEIPPDLVRSTVTSFADERIQVISQQVMTRAVLLDLVEKYDLYSSRRKWATNEEILESMRTDIKLAPVTADISDRRSGSRMSSTIAFKLSFDSTSPANAQKVANDLVSLYLNENLKTRQQKAAETSSFLAEEADRLAKQISEIEAKLADFKERNQGRLPELSSLNMQMVERNDGEMLRIDQQLSTLEDRKIYLEAQLSQVKPSAPLVSSSGERVLDPEDRLKSLQATYAGQAGVYGEDHPDLKRMRREIAALKKETGTDYAPETRETREVLEARLANLRERYSADHPDVQRAEKALKALQADKVAPGGEAVKPTPDAAATPPNPAPTPSVPVASGDMPERTPTPPVVEQKAMQDDAVAKPKTPGTAPIKTKKKPDNPTYIALKTQIDSADLEIKTLKALREELRGKLHMYERRLEQTPEVEREFRNLARDHQNSVARYQEVKAKLMQAEVAQYLEKDRKAERFTLIDPPQFPEKPTSPNRLAILFGGLAISLGSGFGFAFLREALDRSVKGIRDLMRVSPVPVLSVIPYIENARERVRHSKRLKLMVAGAIAALLLFLLIVHFFVKPLPVLWYSTLRRVPF